jgi:rhodanese-related sulfurtransferase
MNSRSFHWPMASGRAARRRSTLIATTATALLFSGLVAGCGSDGRVEQAAGVTFNVENESAPAREPFARLDPAAFEQRMKNEQAMVINVHIPYQGELDGTDAFIPYDKIKNDPRLPKDKNTEILLYCRSGHMSEKAGVDLHDEGYTNIAHLEGGMNAWEASGRKLTYNPEHAAQQGGSHEM